jgi:CheY-like chemotaxis protein
VNSTSKHILLVEDDRVTRTLLKKRIEDLGFNVHIPEEGGEYANAVSIARERDIHIAICDLVLPDGKGARSVISGLSVVKEIKLLKKGIWIFIYSGSVDKQAANKWKKAGVARVFSKDDQTGLDDLLEAVQQFSKKDLIVPKSPFG